MKKIDKLVLKAFVGPFFLSCAVVLFIFLSQYIIKNFKYMVGKDLPLSTFMELFGFFALVMIPVALPLGVLFASLLVYGSLGQHSELVAVKSSGIPSSRLFVPTTIFILVVVGGSFWYNDNVLPFANLKAYRLLYDIKQTKASVNLEEGVFYNGIDGYSIRVDKKLNGGDDLEGVMVYSHDERKGNMQVTLAKTGKMSFVRNGAFLQFDLFDGKSYTEQVSAENRGKPRSIEYVKNDFDSALVLFSLADFAMSETDEKLFLGNTLMQKEHELVKDIDSLNRNLAATKENLPDRVANFLHYYRSPIDSAEDQGQRDKYAGLAVQSVRNNPIKMSSTTASVRDRVGAIDSYLGSTYRGMTSKQANKARKEIFRWKRYVQPTAIFIMFLIGASLGVIIKKGGLGIPVLVSVVFFILFYVTTIIGEKLSKQLVVESVIGSWASNTILGIIAIFFFIQAYRDIRLFEKDYWTSWLSRLKNHKSQ
jgi:lipopolysaccharide export system permease protein